VRKVLTNGLLREHAGHHRFTGSAAHPDEEDYLVHITILESIAVMPIVPPSSRSARLPISYFLPSIIKLAKAADVVERHRRLAEFLIVRVHRLNADVVIRHKESFELWLSLWVLERRHLAQPAHVSRSLTEFGGKKRLDQVPGQLRSLDSSAQTQHIEVIVLDPLLCREMIFD
jgi:hypothetical protein